MRSTATWLSSGLILVAFMAVPARTVEAADPIKLTGCLVRGDGNDGYLLVNVPAMPMSPNTANTQVAPTAIGTSGTYANVFYWLDNDDDLKPHVGHRVEIEGEPKGDVKDGEIKVDRKEQWTEIEIKSDGHDMKAQVPNASVVAPADPDKKMSVLVRRVDVDKVKMVAANCQ